MAKYVGLDISDSTIEIVCLSGSATNPHVVSFARATLAEGIVEFGRIKDEEKLAEVLKKLLSTAKPKAMDAHNIIFGLPENLTYIHTILLPPHPKKEREGLIKEHILQTIPLTATHILYSSRVLQENKEGVEVLTVSVDREDLEMWRDFFKKYKFDIETWDVESLAFYRDIDTQKKKQVCIVDMGSHTTRVSFFDTKGLRFNYTIESGGQDMTRAIADVTKKDITDAEKLKIKDGLTGTDKKMTKIVTEYVENIANQIKKGITYYEEKYATEVELILFAGGTSKLKGLSDYISKILGKEIVVATSRVLSKNIPLEYIEAVGLALRDLSKKWDKRDPEIVWTDAPKLSKRTKKRKAQAIQQGLNIVSSQESMEDAQENPVRKQLIMLFFVVMIGIALVMLAWWYRSTQNNKSKNTTPDLPELQELDIILETHADILDTSTTTDDVVVTSTEDMVTSTVDVATTTVESVTTTDIM